MIFEIVNDVPTITPEGLSIPELLKIWKGDRTKTKSKAYMILAYIYHTVNPKSVYSALAEDDRKKEVARDFMKDEDYKETKIVKEAKEKYKKLTTTHSMRLLKASKEVVDKLSNYLHSVDFVEKGANGKPLHSAKDTIDNMKKIGPLIDSLNKIEDQVKKEQSQKVEKVRGGAEFNIFEE
jgi:tRNA nucleotidyltransferase/poly(A) polymerase